MEIGSAFNSGLEGFQKATEDANKAAEDIAAQTSFSASNFAFEQQTSIDSVDESTVSTSSLSSSFNEIPDLNQSIVDLKVAEFQAKASADVIKTADETLGTILDVRI